MVFMRCYFYDTETDEFLYAKKLEPVCEKDFCYECGECLACCRGSMCHRVYGTTIEHSWIKYVVKDEEEVS